MWRLYQKLLCPSREAFEAGLEGQKSGSRELLSWRPPQIDSQATKDGSKATPRLALPVVPPGTRLWQKTYTHYVRWVGFWQSSARVLDRATTWRVAGGSGQRYQSLPTSFLRGMLPVVLVTSGHKGKSWGIMSWLTNIVHMSWDVFFIVSTTVLEVLCFERLPHTVRVKQSMHTTCQSKAK